MTDVGGVAADRLRAFIERIERLEEEKAALTADIREIFAEAKATGFDTKVMRQVVRLRKMEKADRDEQEHLLDLYQQALGMIAPAPLAETG
ncbi:MAG: DUF2312 domain-containing protein [Alphaproteobacteria bacterium]